MIRKILLPILAMACLSLTACSNDFGKVEQGRTVDYDKDKKVVTFVKDTAVGGAPALYEVPAVVYNMPVDPSETGTPPKAGLRIKLDTEKKIITMYNLSTKAFDMIPFELVDEHKGVDVSKRHVLVYDPATDKPRVFPVVNADEKKVTIYSKRQQLLSTIKLADADFSRYNAADWDSGDEVRIYFKEEGKILRFMNVTRTDIFKR